MLFITVAAAAAAAGARWLCCNGRQNSAVPNRYVCTAIAKCHVFLSRFHAEAVATCEIKSMTKK